MASSHTPRRSLQRYKNEVKKQPEIFTHQNFLGFLEPFLEPLKKRKLTELEKMSEEKTTEYKDDVYARWIGMINERLLGSYRFDDDVEVDVRQFNNPLTLRKQPKTLDLLTSYFKKNKVLENFKSVNYKEALKTYKEQIDRNNRRRKVILNVVVERASMAGYFRLFDLINGKLEEVQKKRVSQKKKSGLNELERGLISEYLERISEFYSVFGDPSQFSENQMEYANVIEDEDADECTSGIVYFN